MEALYRKLIAKDASGCEFTVDKQLFNLQVAGLIAENLPEAKIIYCRRHPLDHALSMFRFNPEKGNIFTSSLSEIASLLVACEQAMRWHEKNFPGNIRQFNYGEFVLNPEPTLRSLLDWLGSEWDEQYLSRPSDPGLIRTASFEQVRQPINSRSLGGWRHYADMMIDAKQIFLDSGLFSDCSFDA